MALGKPSASLLKEVRKNKLSNPQVKAFCDLIIAGWGREDAYIFSGLWNNTYSTIMNHQDMERLISQNENVSSYIDEKVKDKELVKKKAKRIAEDEEKVRVEVSDADIANELSKETQLRELIAAKKMHPEGSKEWLDIKKMIADITRVKQDEIKEEDDFVHFYVPIQCHNCSLYMAKKAKMEKK